MGDATSGPFALSFNPQLRVEFRRPASIVAGTSVEMGIGLGLRAGPARGGPAITHVVFLTHCRDQRSFDTITGPA